MNFRATRLLAANVCTSLVVSSLVISSFAAMTGCATATSAEGDAGKPVLSGDASLPGRVDATVQGLRPDAGVPADASPPPPDASPDCVTGPANLLSNPGFDVGLSPWVEESGSAFPLVVPDTDLTGVDADSGDFFAWMGGYSGDGAAAEDVIRQDFFVPDDATPITLTGVVWIDSAELLAIAFDTIDIQLVNVASGMPVETLVSLSNIDEAASWVPFTVSVVGNYAGQTMQLRVLATLDTSNNTNFLFDTMALTTTTCQ